MLRLFAVFISSAVLFSASPANAVEGPAAAGPIGGTDIRSAMLPPPGLYGGVAVLAGGTLDFVDGNGRTIPPLRDAHLAKQLTGTFLFYVPKLDVLGGSIGFGGMVPAGNQCGHLFEGDDSRCTTSFGDPYLEFDWSRSFAKPRASQYAGAYPIMEGLTVMLAVGLVIPAGPYDSSDLTERALSIGTNIWDVSPAVAATYTTPPIFGEGTEFSAKLYWNNYRENPDTDYRTGDLVNLDFAITEHIGRFQVGIAGFYAVQIEDDKISGSSIPPDGRRGELLTLGGIVNYDMPEYRSSVKVKAFKSVEAENTVESWNVVVGFLKGF
ncbi:MAG: transporter [Hyphomicrobiaceae bacterium]|nr:transporter [Hyphomicrobiaceae bacterium]